VVTVPKKVHEYSSEMIEKETRPSISRRVEW
jgi:hypothetical protein